MIARIIYHRKLFIIVLLILGNIIFSCSKSRSRYKEKLANKREQNTPIPKEPEKLNPEKKRDSQKKSTDSNISNSLSGLYNKLKPSVFVVYALDRNNSGSQGSGFFVKEGIGVSNYHVIEGYNKYSIKTSDGKQYQVKKILYQNIKNDFIIFSISVPRNKYPHTKLAVYRPNVGDDVFAIGNPRGYEFTLSKGIISAYRKKVNLLQTTTEITFGSSGGPLFNQSGEVVGITSSGVGEANLNFAIDIQLVKKYIK